MTVWQLLPLGPTDEYGSPYRSRSALAGNPLLISPQRLVEDGLLRQQELADARVGSDDSAEPIDYATVTSRKRRILEQAFDTFCRDRSAGMHQDDFHDFCQRRRDWLDPYAFYMALSDLHQTPEWTQWPCSSLSARQILATYRNAANHGPARLEHTVQFHRFTQFLFDRQWQSVRQHVRRLGIWIVGDMPIYVAHASCDVWANPELFDVDDLGVPRRVAGVPPDYFSATGQLWGNPLYDWPAMKRQGYAWWVQRLLAVLDQADLVRLDHFRGLQAYWAVSAANRLRPTASGWRVPEPICWRQCGKPGCRWSDRCR